MMICINIISIITIVIKPNECYSHHDGNSVVMGGYTGGVTPTLLANAAQTLYHVGSSLLSAVCTMGYRVYVPCTMWTPHCWFFSVYCAQCHLGVILYIKTQTPFCIATVVEHVYVSITYHSKDLNIVEYMMIHCHLMDMKQHISLAVCLINCYGAGRVRAVAVECTEMRALGICVWVVDRHIQALYMRVFEHAGITHTKLQMGTALHV